MSKKNREKEFSFRLQTKNYREKKNHENNNLKKKTVTETYAVRKFHSQKNKI